VIFHATFDDGRRPSDNGRVSEKHPYEAVGLRTGRDSFTVKTDIPRVPGPLGGIFRLFEVPRKPTTE
jgi:hypothetical protein